jgi:tRNA-specific adenosine deaminase 2
MSIYNERFIREALKVAQEAYDQKEVPVGCVFVKDNQEILAHGRNKPNETCNVSANHNISSANALFTRPHDMLK